MFSTLRNLPKRRKERIQAAAFFIPFGLIASLMVYGIVRWPLAPIHEDAGRFVDKAGQPFTEQAYHQFIAWQWGLAAGFALFFVSILFVSWAIGLPFRSKRPDPSRGS